MGLIPMGTSPQSETRVKLNTKKTMKTLKKLVAAHLNNILGIYNGKTRSWWPGVNEDAIYEDIAKSEHDEYVRQILTDATL